jgi:HlyD family secretion protein
MPRHAKVMAAEPMLPVIGPSSSDEQDATEIIMSEEEELEESLAFKTLMETRKKRRRRNTIIGVIAALAVVGITIFVVSSNAKSGEEESAPVVATATVSQGDFVDSVSATGTAQPVSSVVVSPEIDGIIESVSVAEGQEVKKGDTLFTIRNESLDGAVTTAAEALNSARTALDNAWNDYYRACDEYNQTQGLDGDIAYWEAQIPGLQTAVTNAQLPVDEIEKSSGAQVTAIIDKLDRGEALTPEEQNLLNTWNDLHNKLNQANQNLDHAQSTVTDLKSRRESASSKAAAVDAASASISSAKSSLATAERSYNDAVAQAAKRTVTAPLDGTILVMNANTGAAIGGNGNSSSSGNSSGTNDLIRIADFTHMRVAVDINEVDISSIAVGQQATVTFSALPGVTCDATVESVASVSAAGDSAGGGGGVVTYRVELVIPNPDPNIKPGMSASVTITTQKVDNTLMVPIGALQQDVNGADCVMVVTRGAEGEIVDSRQVPVTVQARSGTDAAISGNLAAGDELMLPDEESAAGDEGAAAAAGAEGDAEAEG